MAYQWVSILASWDQIVFPIPDAASDPVHNQVNDHVIGGLEEQIGGAILDS